MSECSSATPVFAVSPRGKRRGYPETVYHMLRKIKLIIFHSLSVGCATIVSGAQHSKLGYRTF